MIARDDRGWFAYGSVPRRETRHQRRIRIASERARRRRGHVLLTSAILLAGLGIGLATNIGLFYWNSAQAGQALIRQATQEIKNGTSQSLAACEGLSPLPNPLGILTAPTIGLEAPVVQGTSDPQLDVAVGHETASALPADPGTSVLAAHDVTWFTDIDNLAIGQMVDYENACATYQFRVFHHGVVNAGAPVYESRGDPQLVLVTCWPTNALFYTNKRYLVYASLARTITNQHAVPQAATPPSGSLVVPVPEALLAQTSRESAPLGVLAFAGSPEPKWQESPAPIQLEQSALSEYFAALLSVEQDQPGQWADLTANDGAPWLAATPLMLAQITHYNQGVSLTLNMNGTTPVSVDISTVVVVSRGTQPGVYRLSVTETNVNGTLVLTSWKMAAQ